MFNFKINREDLNLEEFKNIVKDIQKEYKEFDYKLNHIRGFNFKSKGNGLTYVIDSVYVYIAKFKDDCKVSTLYKAIDYLDGVVILEDLKCKGCNNSLRYTELLDYGNCKCEYCQD